ncbi:hypothetical protein HYV69_01005 [Candidatus Uhrbacteria bacterium]|nr:hypothetical protein [Candidatus Uhrbacteria bacterium]
MKCLILIICILAGVSILHISQNQDEARATSQTHRTKQVPIVNYTTNELEESLRILLATHPTPGIRTKLYKAIEDTEVAVSWTDDYAAAFMLVPKKMISSSESDTQDLQPTLMVKPQLLFGNKDYAQLVIFHEYIHFRQWKYKTLPEDTFLFEPIGSSTDPVDHCTKKWRAELEAYHKECEFTRLAKTINLLPLCAYSGTPEYKDELFKTLVKGDMSMRLCSSLVQIH